MHLFMQRQDSENLKCEKKIKQDIRLYRMDRLIWMLGIKPRTLFSVTTHSPYCDLYLHVPLKPHVIGEALQKRLGLRMCCWNWFMVNARIKGVQVCMWTLPTCSLDRIWDNYLIQLNYILKLLLVLHYTDSVYVRYSFIFYMCKHVKHYIWIYTWRKSIGRKNKSNKNDLVLSHIKTHS